MKKKYTKTEWSQLLEGATIIKWYRRPYVKLNYKYWKFRNKIINLIKGKRIKR